MVTFLGVIIVAISTLGISLAIPDNRNSVCLRPAAPENGGVLYKPRSNAAAAFWCNTGFVLIGDFEVACVDGHWNASFPNCRQWKPCDLVLRNGYILADRISEKGRWAFPQSAATYACDKGFKQGTTGSNTFCDFGKWRPRPYCISIASSQMQQHYRKDTRVNGAGPISVSDRNTELEINPHTMLENQKNGACSSPKNPKDGKVHYEKSIDVTATFICDTGFVLIGERTVHCVDGQWTGSFPKCKKWTPCDLALENGFILASDTSDKGQWAFPKSPATYECRAGFKRGTASKILSCELGKWRPHPSCIKRGLSEEKEYNAFINKTRCTKPPFVRNTETIVGRLYKSNEVFKYKCKYGYRHRKSTSGVLHCKYGKWMPEPNTSPMQCDPVYCGPPPELPNSSVVSGTRFFYNDLVTYTCNKGYNSDLRNSQKALCLANGKWSKVVDCKALTCDPLTRDDNGFFEKIEGEGFAYNSTYRIGCNHGYQFDNSDIEMETRCNEDGRWSSPQSKCQLISCPALLPDETNILHISYGRNFDYGSVHVFHCKPGFRFKTTDIGQPMAMKCGEKGKWSNVQPTCEVISCQPLKEDKNGGYKKLFGESFNFDVVYRLNCNPGYTFHGMEPDEAIITMCNEYGVWTKHQPTCEKMETAEQNGWGPKAIGQRTRREIDDSGSPIKGKCDKPPIIPNTYTIENRLYTEGDYIRYTCQSGYEKKWFTTSFLQCHDGLWKKTNDWDGMECIPVQCPKLVTGENSIITINNGGLELRYKTSVHVECKPGYKYLNVTEKTETNLTCTEDGKWSDNPPKCEEIRCDRLEDASISYEFAHGSDFRYNSTCRVKCKHGYKFPDGINETEMLFTCMENGQWSPNRTKCEEIRCDKLEEDNSCRYEAIDGSAEFRCNSTFRVKCKDGYIKPGEFAGKEMEIRCMENGKWSSNRTKCEDSNPKSAGISIGPVFSIHNAVTYFCLEIVVIYLTNSIGW